MYISLMIRGCEACNYNHTHTHTHTVPVNSGAGVRIVASVR